MTAVNTKKNIYQLENWKGKFEKIEISDKLFKPKHSVSYASKLAGGFEKEKKN